MKILSHPSIKDISVEGLLYALSDPTRVKIFSDIARSDCSKICSDYLGCTETPLPKSTLSQHFKILREAGLIRSERRGKEMHNTSRCAEFKERFGPMVESIIDAYLKQNKKLKPRKK